MVTYGRPRHPGRNLVCLNDQLIFHVGITDEEICLMKKAKAWLSIIPVVFEKIAYLALRLGSLLIISLLLITDKPSTPFFMPFRNNLFKAFFSFKSLAIISFPILLKSMPFFWQ